MKKAFRKRPQVNNGRLWGLLALVAGLALGVVAGFLLHQAEPDSAAPWQLSLTYQERFIELAAREYRANGDADFVIWLLEGWDKAKLAALLVDMEANAADPGKEQRLGALREALDIPAAEPSFLQLLKRQPVIMLLGLCSGVVLLLAGVTGMFLAAEEERVRQALEQAVLVQAEANAAAANIQLSPTTRPANKNPEQPSALSIGSSLNDRENEGRPARSSEVDLSETQPAQSAPRPNQRTGESPQTTTPVKTQPAAQSAQPAAPKPEGQLPWQTGQTAAPPPEEAPKPLVEESELTTGGTIEDLVADVFDDNDEQLHQQAVLKGLGPVDIDELAALLQKVKGDLLFGERRITEAGAAENHKQETGTR